VSITNIRQTLISLSVSSAAISVALLGLVRLGPPINGSDMVGTLLLTFVIVLGFSALGMLLLLPVAWLLTRSALSPPVAIGALLLAAAALGWLLLAWVPENSWIGGVAGAITAAIWCAFNGERLRAHAVA
jgi:hypothetical protein